MIDLGTVRPGSTIRIPFSSFDKDDGSSITMTNYAAADILIYKDGSTTERASTAGFTATTDFDTKTGKHVAVIDLADDTTADFYKAGSEYLVAIDAVTVDTVTTGGWIARFRIGYPNAYLDTSIATLASQTSFTLTAGPAEDDALNGMVLLVHDKASAVQVTRVVVEDYTGASKTVTLRAAPATTFTIAAGDNVSAVGFDTSNVTHFAGSAITSAAGIPEVKVASIAANAITASAIATGAIDADAIAADAITAAKVADGTIDAATFAAGAITATVIATGAIDADALAADAGTEIASAVWDMDATGHQTGGTFGQAIGDPGADTTTIYQSVVTDAAGTNVAADIIAIKAQTAAIETDTAEIGAAGAGLTALATQASVNTIDDFLDTEVAAIKAKTDNLPASPAAVGSAMTLATGAVSADALATDAVTEITDAILALVIETGLTLKNALRLIASASAGKLSGAATNTVVIRNAVADDKNRITATVDSDGNRSAITLDLT